MSGIIVEKNKSIRAIAGKTPFSSEKVEFFVPEGTSIRQILTSAQIPEYLSVIVDLNGVPIFPKDYEITIPKIGDMISIIAVPTGGGGGKNAYSILATVAVIALAAFAPYGIASLAGGNLLTFAGMSTAATISMYQAGAMVVGGLLLNALIPSQNPLKAAQSYEESPTYNISAGNTVNKYGPIPQVLGRVKCVPPFAATPYTTLQGNDQYLHVLYCLGYSAYAYDFKFGETSLDEFQDVQTEVIQGNKLSTLYPWNIHEDTESSAITYAADWNAATVVTRTTQPNCRSFSIDITAPTGLSQIDTEDGSRIQLATSFEVNYRETGTSGDWLGQTAAIAAQQLDVSGRVRERSGERSVYVDWWGKAKIAIGFSAIRNLGFAICRIKGTGSAVTITEDIREAWLVTAGYYAPSMNVDGVTLEIGAGVVDASTISLQGCTTSQLRQSLWFDPGKSSQWDVRIRRTTQDYAEVVGDYAYVDDTNLTALRSYQTGYPVTEPSVFLIAMRIKATDQLNGTLDTFSCKAQLVANDYDAATGTWIARETRNPASIYRYILQGHGNKRPLLDAQIDLTTLATWHTLCASKGWEFNHFVDYRSSVQEMLSTVASAGRAAPAYIDGKYSVVMDVAQTNYIQVFTPRNSWGFSYEKAFVNFPHGFRVRFKNEEKDYEEDEIIVCDDGYTESTATQLDELSLVGITNYRQAWSYARYYLACARLRPETYTFQTDFEHIRCSRGDLILVSHDVIKVGVGQARVKSFTNDGTNITTITVDDVFPMEVSKSYVFRLRRSNGDIDLINLTTSAGYSSTFTVSDTLAIADAPEVGDLVLFGELDNESIDCLVKEIKPSSDLTAEIICVPASPTIHNADTSIPSFDSKITEPASPYGVYVPTIIGTRSDESVLYTDNLGNLHSRIAVSLKPVSKAGMIQKTMVSYYNIKEEPTTTLGSIVYHINGAIYEVVDSYQNEILLSKEIYDGESYKIHACYMVDGKWCKWSEWTQVTVTGQTSLPDDVTGFLINIVNDLAFLSWTKVDDSDLASYEIKHTPATSGALWTTAYRIGELIDKSATTAIRPAIQGTYLIKAIDRGGRESANATSIINTASPIINMNVAETTTEITPFSGTKYNVIEDYNNELTLAYAADFFDSTDVFTNNDWFLIDSNYGFESSGYYYFADTVDLGSTHVCRVSATVTAKGVDLSGDFFSGSDFFIASDFFGAISGQWAAIVEMGTTLDDPSGAEILMSPEGEILLTPDGEILTGGGGTGTVTWSTWKQIDLGDYTARGFQFRVKLSATEWGVTPSVSSIVVSVDMPDRLISEADVVVPVAGKDIVFSPAYYALKGLGIAAQDLTVGDYYTITNKTVSGFTINFFNSSDGTTATVTSVERTMDYIATGYGKIIT